MSNDEFKLEPTDTPLPFGDPSPVDKAPAARCESCGGPADDGDLCAACKRAFEGVLKQFDEAPEPLPVPTMAANEPVAHQPTSAVELEALFDQLGDQLGDQLAVAPPPPAAVEQSSTLESAPIVEEPVVEEPVVAEPQVVAAAPVVALEATIDVRPAVVEEPAVVATPAVAATPAIVEEPAPPPAPVEAAAPKPAPAVVPAAAHAPVPPRRGLRTLGAVAAAAIVIATIGIPLSKLWLSRQKIVVVQQPAPAAARAPEKAPVKKEPVVAAAPKVETPVAPPPAPAPKPAPRLAPKPTRPTVVPAQPAVEAPVLAVNTPSVTSIPTAEPVTVAAPPPPPPAAAMGPFFESRDVDRAPQVTSRIEPNLPDGVDLNRQEILIVRVLISQAGQPSLVSLLRRSKSGSALDAAVVDAVKRWSFSPAIRRGEAVSCFLNVGVPVGSKP